MNDTHGSEPFPKCDVQSVWKKSAACLLSWAVGHDSEKQVGMRLTECHFNKQKRTRKTQNVLGLVEKNPLELPPEGFRFPKTCRALARKKCSLRAQGAASLATPFGAWPPAASSGCLASHRWKTPKPDFSGLPLEPGRSRLHGASWLPFRFSFKSPQNRRTTQTNPCTPIHSVALSGPNCPSFRHLRQYSERETKRKLAICKTHPNRL